MSLTAMTIVARILLALVGFGLVGAGVLYGILGIWGADRGSPDAWILALLGLLAAAVGAGLLLCAKTPSVRQPLMAAAVETEFDVLATLKGADRKNLVLHHYRSTVRNMKINGPLLMEFDPQACEEFLMF
jgi:hypothetical protein